MFPYLNYDNFLLFMASIPPHLEVVSKGIFLAYSSDYIILKPFSLEKHSP